MRARVTPVASPCCPPRLTPTVLSCWSEGFWGCRTTAWLVLLAVPRGANQYPFQEVGGYSILDKGNPGVSTRNRSPGRAGCIIASVALSHFTDPDCFVAPLLAATHTQPLNSRLETARVCIQYPVAGIRYHLRNGKGLPSGSAGIFADGNPFSLGKEVRKTSRVVCTRLFCVRPPPHQQHKERT